MFFTSRLSLGLVVWMAIAAFGQNTPPKYPPLPDGIKMDADIAYDRHPETKLDVFWAAGTQQGKRPGVLVIHGGGWTGGTKEGQWDNFVRPYLDKGFVVANVEYRLAKAAIAPAAVEDSLKAAEWFSQNASKYGVDRSRMVVTGGSAGGHLSLMVGMTPKSAGLGKRAKVAAVINFYGITDVADQLAGPNMRNYAVTWLPDSPNRLEIARRVSPMTYVRKDVPAILTLHGDADQTVPYEHGVQLTRALNTVGAKSEMISVPQGRHGFPKEKMSELYVQIFAFLTRQGVIR
jgi:acetyl esterase/lipase